MVIENILKQRIIYNWARAQAEVIDCECESRHIAKVIRFLLLVLQIYQRVDLKEMMKL